MKIIVALIEHEPLDEYNTLRLDGCGKARWINRNVLVELNNSDDPGVA